MTGTNGCLCHAPSNQEASTCEDNKGCVSECGCFFCVHERLVPKSSLTLLLEVLRHVKAATVVLKASPAAQRRRWTPSAASNNSCHVQWRQVWSASAKWPIRLLNSV